MKELIEKYGTYEYVDVGITNNGKEMTYKETVDLLNENEQLKNEVYDWKASAEDYLKLGQSLKKENEQLKQQIESYKKVIEDCDNLFCKYGVDTSNLQAVEELFKTLDSDGDVE